ncbi:MAG: T9SS type A sorting domain-containing protein [Bacteroidia bacterium]|nr:T9SS type A sorting domain-containing protein [Bacteroidia bacterium]
MKKRTLLLITAFLAAFLTHINAQLSVESNGMIVMDAQNGGFLKAPRFVLNSAGTNLSGINTGLSILNSDTTKNNWVRFLIGTKNANDSYEDFVAICSQFKSHESADKGVDFHIATLNNGYYASRFAIYNNTSSVNDVLFYFATGNTGNDTRGAWLDNSGSGEPTFRPTSSGYGYIGTADNYWHALYANSAYYNDHATITSDERAKNDIANINKGVLDRLNQVRGVTYHLNTPSTSAKNANTNGIDVNAIYDSEDDRPSFSAEVDAKTSLARSAEDKKAGNIVHYGFVAQELIKIFPELVKYDSINDVFGVQYTAMIPLLIEGLKEQSAIISAQSIKLKEMENAMIALQNSESTTLKKTTSTSTILAGSVASNAFLYQNTPNPFTYDTQIKYYIPESTKIAILCIFTLQGDLLLSETITQTGFGEKIINGSELSPGMYLYSLLVDGQEVDTKKMILTK